MTKPTAPVPLPAVYRHDNLETKQFIIVHGTLTVSEAGEVIFIANENTFKIILKTLEK